MQAKEVGVIGLGVMGRSLALNIARNGYGVSGFDINPDTRQKAKTVSDGKGVEIISSLSVFLDSLDLPRTILLMVPAGKAVDSVLGDLFPRLDRGDIVIDGGNSYFSDSTRRAQEAERQGILYVGAGISGGEEGALWGPSIMPGGRETAWPQIKPVLQSIAAKAEGEPCCDWIGPEGSGHFVKMIHNGIEYGDMQMICEAYTLMEQLLKTSPQEMSDIFARWNTGELDSYLIQITADILAMVDPETGKPMVDVILDTAGQKGTGKWTSQVALDLGTPAPTIAEAVFARTLSAIKEERIHAASHLSGPTPSYEGNPADLIDAIRDTLYASKICSYAQGFQIIRDANRDFQWSLRPGQIAKLWRAGCIIRARFLNNMSAAFHRSPDMPNLLLDETFREAVHTRQDAWRFVVATAVHNGIPVPAFGSALAYYDAYRSNRLPANLLQAQRDYFGAHTYERIDKPRGQFFHTQWKRLHTPE